MPDILEHWGQSQIQHGQENNRIYLMKLNPNDLPAILTRLDELAEEHSYTKLFAKVPAACVEPFVADGYAIEASVPDFYNGSEDGVFLGKYLQQMRSIETRPEQVEEVLNAAEAYSDMPAKESKLACRQLCPSDSEAMAELYRLVFATYPFPIHDPGYLEKTMQEDVHYFGVHEENKLVAVASAEVDVKASNAEMTDFATHPDARGGGLATGLLQTMETAMQDEGIHTAYTIARAYSFGMNITFAKCGYTYSGTLTNNTQISGGLESMNVWYKPLV